MTTTQKIRKDIQQIAKRSMDGETVRDIAKEYECSHGLIIRVMHQELPQKYFIDRMKKRMKK